jgi:hypothetical protein
MEAKLDPSQFGNYKEISIQHYLIQMLLSILSVLDNNSKGDTFAVVVNLVDWNNAFPRQCPTLGVKSLIENGVRPSLIIKGGGPLNLKSQGWLDNINEWTKFPLAPMGVLTPGSAHARTSARPPIDTSGNFPAHVSA